MVHFTALKLKRLFTTGYSWSRSTQHTLWTRRGLYLIIKIKYGCSSQVHSECSDWTNTIAAFFFCIFIFISTFYSFTQNMHSLTHTVCNTLGALWDIPSFLNTHACSIHTCTDKFLCEPQGLAKQRVPSVNTLKGTHKKTVSVGNTVSLRDGGSQMCINPTLTTLHGLYNWITFHAHTDLVSQQAKVISPGHSFPSSSAKMTNVLRQRTIKTKRKWGRSYIFAKWDDLQILCA